MRVLVCGGRNYKNEYAMYGHLTALHNEVHITHIIHGGASGADEIAGKWARSWGVQEVVCEPNWDKYGSAAGPIRNTSMLGLGPDLVLAFPGGKGTDNMRAQAEMAGITVQRCE